MSKIICPVCEGSGYVILGRGGSEREVTCSRCHGHGKVEEKEEGKERKEYLTEG